MTGRPGAQLNLNARLFNRVDRQPLGLVSGQVFNMLAYLQGSFLLGHLWASSCHVECLLLQ